MGRVDSTMYDVATDSIIVHSGKWSAHIFSLADSPSSIGYVSILLDPDLVKAKKVRLTAWAKSENTSGSAVFFARMGEMPEGEESKTLGKKVFEEISQFAGTTQDELPEWIFYNGEQSIKGDTEWTKHELTFDVPEKTISLWFGAILDGRGKIWVDDFSYSIVGKLPTDSSYKDISPFIVKPEDLDFELP